MATKGKRHTIVLKDPGKPNFVSVISITKDYDRKHPLYAITLRKVPERESNTLNHGENREIQSSLSEFKDVFPKKLPKGLPPKRIQDFKIALKEDAVPRKKGPYRMSSAELEELKNQLTELVDQGFIRPSASPWGALVLFVSKKDGNLRLCVDYRALN